METIQGQPGENFNSRFTLLDMPSQHPGCCIVCGAVDRPVVDFGADIDWEHKGVGRAYFCEYCIRQAASKFPEEPVDPNETVVSRVWHEQQLQEQKENLYDGLLDYLNRFDSRNSVVPIYGNDDSVPEQAESENDRESESDVPAVSGFNPETDKSTSVEGSFGVSGDSSDGSFEFKF